ncbi:MAG: Xyloglucanase Xgh74A precursor [Firmicutes bacterium ADurb.Bin419]|nr:MAG: Xyloglucanase Xgh74A precursor [Firmicutes bacterium ADurb.Bin419]
MKKVTRKVSLVLVLVILCQLFAAIPIKAEGICGDLNGDNSVNSIDFALLRSYLLKIDKASVSDFEARADVNQDGSVNSIDFAAFRMYLLGMIKSLPYLKDQPVVIPTPTSEGNLISTPVPYDATVNTDFVDANTQFATKLFQKLSNEGTNENIFFSPFGISMTFSMAYQGAGSTTKDAMAKALDYTGMSDEVMNQSYVDHLNYFKRLYPQVELNIANSIWLNESFKAKESFLTKNLEVFKARSSYLDFANPEACNIMNDWISDATNGKIDNMIKGPLSSQMSMYLMNAIYFNGSWAEEFDETKTSYRSFTNISGQVKYVPMMYKKAPFRSAETSEAKAIEIPYGSGNVSMYCILPKADTVNDFISEFDSSKWSEIKAGLIKSNDIAFYLPRFSIEYEPQDLKGKLSELGMGEAFSDNADFFGIAESIWLDEVKHKSVIDVNEKGTEAVSGTIIGIPTPSLVKWFELDKPFVFVIADNATGTILFMGKVVDLD